MRLRDRIALTLFATTFIGATALGTVWSGGGGIDAGSVAAALLFFSLWGALMYLVWTLD